MAPLSLTARAQKALGLAPGRGDEQILLGLILEGGSVPAKLLKVRGLDPGHVRASMSSAPEIWNVLGAAEAVASRLRHGEVGTEHLMLALIEDETSGAALLLARQGVKPADLRADLYEIMGVRS